MTFGLVLNYARRGLPEMASAGAGESSSSGSRQAQRQEDGCSKYARYTAEQIDELERVYAECPKPSALRRHQLIRECRVLANVESKQIKVWFQNRRCREKQRKETSTLHTVNKKLSAMNKLLVEENNRLQKQLSELVCENGSMRHRVLPQSGTTDVRSESMVTTPQRPPLADVNNPTGLLAIAEATLTEFLGKAIGSSVDWVQMLGMKPGPDSLGIVSVLHSCSRVAARACGLVCLEPTKIVDILKDRPTWFGDCRSLEVYNVFPTENGGSIELLHMQMYAPTTLAPACDFWTMRYCTRMEDGSLVVCERSLSASGTCPIPSATSQFTRAEMLPSGYLVRLCDGGSIIHIVDHLDLKAWSVPEVLRPLYQSSKILAQKMTCAALRHVRQIGQETSGEVVYGMGTQPAVLRTFSQRLNRGFNDAVNGFNNDGWSLVNSDGSEDVIVAVNSSKKFAAGANPSSALPFHGGIICVKASILLKNVPPALMIRFLRERRSEWADFSVDAYIASLMKAGAYNIPGSRVSSLYGSQVIMPLGHTMEEELLEVIRLEGQALTQDEAVLSRGVHLLQICSGMVESIVGGACSELVFAPFDENVPDDVPLIPSGFRIISLDSKTDAFMANSTLDLASSLEATTHLAIDASQHAYSTCSVLTVAFQFPFELHLQDTVATMAQQYVRSVLSSVQRLSMAMDPPAVGPHVGQPSPGSPEALILGDWICQSYRYHLGEDLVQFDSSMGDKSLELLWNHQDAILCFTLKPIPVFTFANQAGLDMLETSMVALQGTAIDRIFDVAGKSSLCAELAKIMQQGFTYLPGGICTSTMGRHVAYEQALAWKVLAEDKTFYCIAIAFINWSFV